ncbi:hypothetical protein GCM10010406_30070 [Streptomyces thermolineatus]|uniref:Lipoprotein n=1 Tax=Streptomyces thermolineatus TaxID=44033 RepID=A0ABP5Z3X0_9ACTN
MLAAAVGTATAAVLLGGCAGDGAGTAERSAAAAMRRRAADGAAALLERYDATGRAHPALAAGLAPLRAQTAQHVEAFGGVPAAPPPALSAGSAPASQDPSAPAGASSPAGASAEPGPAAAVPGDRGEALRALASAASRQSDAFLADLTEAPGDLARLLASVAAACAAHATLLPELTA